MECYGFKSEDRPGNYFPLPNAVFYLGLTAGALAVYVPNSQTRNRRFCPNKKNCFCDNSIEIKLCRASQYRSKPARLSKEQ